MLKSKKINIGISIGDPNGIGIEIILKVLSESHLYEKCNFIIYSSLDLIVKQQDFFKITTLPLKMWTFVFHTVPVRIAST